MRSSKFWLAALASFTLASCGIRGTNLSSDRVELPQSMRMYQDSLLSTFERRSGRIAVIGRDGNVSVMDQTGKSAVQITRDATARNARGKLSKSYQVPIWSPDGTKLAFVENTTERQSTSTAIEVKPDRVIIEHGEDSQRFEQTPGNAQRGSGLRPVPSDKSTTELAPDRVVIERGLGAGKLINSALYMASADGKAPLTELTLTEGDAIDFFDWSPKSSQLAFQIRTDRGSSKLKLIDVDAGRPRELLSGDTRWSWSPDGASILARQDTGSRSASASLQLIDTTTEKTSALATRANLPFRTPHYSPDNRAMLLTQDTRSGAELWLADANGGMSRKLASFSGRISFAWSPAGVNVAYLVRENTGQRGSALHVVDVNTGDDRVVTPYPISGFFWSPDGQRLLAFGPVRAQDLPDEYPGMELVSSQSTNVMEIFMVDIQKPNTRRLYLFEPTRIFNNILNDFDRYSRALTLWSPDSKRIAFPLQFAGRDGTIEILVESEATGSLYPRLLTYGSMAVWSPK